MYTGKLKFSGRYELSTHSIDKGIVSDNGDLLVQFSLCNNICSFIWM